MRKHLERREVPLSENVIRRFRRPLSSIFPVFIGIWCISAQAAVSSFQTVEFGGIVKISLPKNWAYLDKYVADHLNTSSEALSRISGLVIAQGDNRVLVAANAYDDKGKTRATLRLSVRKAVSPSQTDMRELGKQPKNVIQSALLPSANEIVEAMLKVSGVKSYKIRAVKIDQNGTLVCSLASFEGDYDNRSVVSSTWVCPLGDRTIKLSASYEKHLESVYLPTINYVWSSLAVVGNN